MKVKLLRKWIAAGNMLPGDIVEIDDSLVEYGLRVGLCEQISKPEKPPTENIVKATDTPATPVKRTGRRRSKK